VLISRMRAAKRDTPVLALTRTSSAEIRMRALNAGADDVVHRQTDVLELIARMKAIVRRSRG
jgi:DNA-binding response OmpR family regulator